MSRSAARPDASALRSRFRSESRPPDGVGSATASSARSCSCGVCASRISWAPTPIDSRCDMSETDRRVLALLVFARAPEAGRAKTRLIPALGAVGAARLQARMTEQTLAAACGSGVGDIQLWCTPGAEHPFFD